MTGPGAGSPDISVVLATDAYETLAPVIACLRRQTQPARLEVVIVAPSASLGSVNWSELEHFAFVRIVDTGAPLSLAAARAAGVRAASAPLVFLGETHCFPEPAMLEYLVAAFDDERCAAVVPAIVNANPRGPISWASYLTDYGMWNAGRSPGALETPTLYNGAYRRARLLALDAELETLLDAASEELWPRLKARGYYAVFEPRARTDHLNVSEVGAMIRLRFFAGTLIGRERARHWTPMRRLLYVIAAPIIVLVVAWRSRSNARFREASARLPVGTLPTIVLGAAAKIAGEVIGYAGGTWASADRRLTEIELHKVRYTDMSTHAHV